MAGERHGTSMGTAWCVWIRLNSLWSQCRVLSPHAKKRRPACNVPTAGVWSYLNCPASRGIVIEFHAEARDISSSNRPDRLWGQHGLLLKGHRASFPGVKLPKREADNLPSSSAELTNEWTCISTPPICRHGVHKDNFTFVDVVAEIVISLNRTDVTQRISLI
jgi:hypothetical protein